MKVMRFWHFSNVNVILHKRYRVAYFEDNGTLNRINSVALPKDIVFLKEVLRGNIELEGDVDLEDFVDNSSRHTQELEKYNNIFFRKYASTNLGRLNLRNIPYEMIDSVEEESKRIYGRYHGTRGHIINMAMNLSLKLRDGRVRVAKRSRSYAKRVLEGDVTSPLHEAFIELKKDFQSRLDDLKALITSQLGVSVPRKTIKKYAKLDKAKNVSNHLKKYFRESFTRNDFKRAVLGIYHYGDDRTVDSYLDSLVVDGDIVKDRRVGYKGSMMYRFQDNKLYDEFQGPEAMKNFIVKFKENFVGQVQTTKNELKDFIQSFTGLSDVKSVSNRLDALLVAGYLVPFGSTDNVFDVCIT